MKRRLPLPFSDPNGATTAAVEEKKAFLNGSADADDGASKVDIVGTRKGTQVQVQAVALGCFKG